MLAVIRLALHVGTRVQPGPAKIWDSDGPPGGFFYPISSRTVPGVVPQGLEIKAMSILSPGSAHRENEPPASLFGRKHPTEDKSPADRG